MVPPQIETMRAGGEAHGNMAGASPGKKTMIVEDRSDLPRARGIGDGANQQSGRRRRANDAKAVLPGMFNQRHGTILVSSPAEQGQPRSCGPRNIEGRLALDKLGCGNLREGALGALTFDRAIELDSPTAYHGV